MQWAGIDRMRDNPLFGLGARTSLRVRRTCYEWLRERVGGFEGKIVLDHGATPDTTSPDSNCHLGWLLADGATVYVTSAEDISHLPALFAGIDVVAWPPQGGDLPRPDLVISNSVIAHVGDRAAQLQFVEDLLRLGDAVYLTTPNRRHWLEFHTKLPLAHWLPDERYHAVLSRLGLGFWTHLHLLDRSDLEALLAAALSRCGAQARLEWFEPRLLGAVSNLVVLAHVSR
jgi:hypothetical protein